MTIILPRSRFLHVPKTGGTWVSTILKSSGLVFAAVPGENPHPIRRLSPGQGLFTFAFVRNPLTWYPSYWKYKTKVGWNLYKPFDKNCQADTFHQFLDKVIEKHPGYFSDLLNYYVGPPNDSIDFIGKQENLVEDFLTALGLAQEAYDSNFLELVRASKPINVAPQGDRFLDVYPPGYTEKIYELDINTFNRFGYSPRLNENQKT